MTNLIPLINNSLTPEMQGILYFLSLQAQRNSEHIYCTGGFVRDLLLGSENRQLNLMITGSAVDFARQLITLLPGKLTVCEKFGTATLILSKGFVFDMVTAKIEFNPFAKITKTSHEDSLLKNDLFKRDFTIDTLACSLSRENFGELYDFFDGLADLKNKNLRVLYRLSLVDKPLRILRLVRLEQRLNFSIEEETEILLQQAIAHNVLNRVSKESLSWEVRLLFKEPAPVKILLRLLDLKLFNQVFPRINMNSKLVNRLNYLEGVLHRMAKEKTVQQENIFLAYLCLLFSDLSNHDLHYMCHFLRLKRKERQAVFHIFNDRVAFQNEGDYLAFISNFIT